MDDVKLEGRKPYGAATAAHCTPGDRPPAVPPYPAAAPASTTARPSASRQCTDRRENVTADGRIATHCPGWPLQRCSASRCAGRAFGAPFTLEPLPAQRA